MASVENEPVRQRVRSKAERPRKTRIARFGGRAFGRGLSVAMIAIAAVYSVAILKFASMDIATYAGPWLTDHQPDVLYGMGAPAQVRGASGAWLPAPAGERAAFAYPHWAYRTPQDGRIVVDFATDGGVDRVSCSRSAESLAGCPPILGIGLGTLEDDLVARLGTPPQQSYAGDTKRITYPDLGVTFELRQFQVEAISLANGGGFPMRLLRLLVP